VKLISGSEYLSQYIDLEKYVWSQFDMDEENLNKLEGGVFKQKGK
jgi:hypothetical protein